MPSKTMPKIKLQSDDGELFDVPPPMVKCFKRIKLMLDDPFKTKTIEEVVPVPNVNASSLQKVLEWAEYHKDDESLEENNGHILSICEWDRELLQVEKNVLIELVLAAHYLDIQGLLDVTCLAYIDFTKNEAPRYEPSDSDATDDEFVAEQQQKDYFSMSIEFESDSSDDGEK